MTTSAVHSYGAEDVLAYTAGADLTDKKNHVVAIDTSGELALPSANGDGLGVLLNNPDDTEQGDVMTGVSRRIEIVAGGAIGAGIEFAVKADGRIAVAAGVTTKVMGITEQAAAADGDLITCLWRPAGFFAQS